MYTDLGGRKQAESLTFKTDSHDTDMTGIPHSMTACRPRQRGCSGGRGRLGLDLHSMAIQKHSYRVNQRASTFSFSTHASWTPSRSNFFMGPPTTPSAGMRQHGRGNGNGGYTIYGSAHQARQGVPPPPLPPMNPYYHSQGQNSPIYTISARPGRPIATRRYRPGH
jgi:hypothetical protein